MSLVVLSWVGGVGGCCVLSCTFLGGVGGLLCTLLV